MSSDPPHDRRDEFEDVALPHLNPLFNLALSLTRNRKDLYPAAARLWMGIWAFGLLMVAEYVLATNLMGARPSSYFSHWATPAGAIGLAGQIAFALIPFVQRITRS